MEEFRINWQLVSLLMVSGQGLLFLLVLLLQQRSNRRANLVLSALVFLLLWHHLDFIINTSFWYQVFPYFYTPNYLSWFLFGPLLYLYIKYLLDPDYRPGVLVKLSFLPAVVSFVNYFGLFSMDHAAKVELIRQTAILNVSDMSRFFVPLLHGSVIFYAQLVVLAGSLAVCGSALRNAARSGASGQDRQSGLNLRWLYFVLVAFALAAMLSNFYFRAIWVSPVLGLDTKYLYIVPLTMFLFVLELGAFLRPEVYTRFSGIESARRKYQNSNLGDAEMGQILKKLEQIMAREKPFLESDLRIATIAKTIDIPVNHLSQAINQRLGKSFTELINEYRVSEAQAILRRDSHSAGNLLSVALEAGFNNKTSFLNAFKKNLHMSPSTYQKSLQQHEQA